MDQRKNERKILMALHAENKSKANYSSVKETNEQNKRIGFPPNRLSLEAIFQFLHKIDGH